MEKEREETRETGRVGEGVGERVVGGHGGLERSFALLLIEIRLSPLFFFFNFYFVNSMNLATLLHRELGK